MRTIPAIALALVLAAGTVPVGAQDFLAPLEDFVETLTEAPARRQTPPRATPDEVARPAVATPPPVPRPRPPSLPDGPVVAPPTPPAEDEAPEAEPERPAEQEPAETAPTEAEPVAEPAEPEPEPEPDRVYQVACPAVLQGLVEAELAPPLSEGICGEQSPLLVTAVLSRGRMVPLSSPVTTNCQMASALPGWIADVDGYAEAMLGTRIAEVTTGTSYMCRNRNNAAGGFTSEHGFANAVDVTGFTLEDGRAIGVAADWLPAAEPEGRLLRLAHDAACGGFSTVLGPEANDEHADHLHLDLGCHGASCRARICE